MRRSHRTRLLVALALTAIPLGIHVARHVRERRDAAARPADEGITRELDHGPAAAAPRLAFEDRSAASGLAVVPMQGARTNVLPEDMGPGVAAADYDGDGRDDILITNGPARWSAAPRRGPRPSLYRNRGDGTFADVTEAAGLPECGFSYAACFADLDNDGFPDLAITTYDGLRLLRNTGDGRFEDTTARAPAVAGWTLGLGFGDYDFDGVLDLYVGRYVDFQADRTAGPMSQQYGRAVPPSLNPTSFAPLPNVLLRGRGDGRFEDVTAGAGVANPDGKTLAVVFCDLNGDRWPDLYVGNDTSPNALYLNDRGRRFVDRSAASWTADVRAAMGIGVGDYDHDGDLDMFVTHWVAQENALYRNLVDKRLGKRPPAGTPVTPTFTDVCDAVGLGQSSLDHVKWGTDFEDFDSDGRLDLFVACGSTLQSAADPAQLVPEPCLVYWNAGAEFVSVGAEAGPFFARPVHGRGVTMADFDGDGDVDVVVGQNRGPPVYLANATASTHRWLAIHPVGTLSNRGGKNVLVRATVGGQTQTVEVGASSSYASGRPLVARFGIGGAAAVDQLVVEWPSGRVQRLANVPAGRTLRVVEPVM